MVTTHDWAFSMQFVPSSHGNRDGRNNRGTIGSGVFYVVRIWDIEEDPGTLEILILS
jgi:hypothetical protein